MEGKIGDKQLVMFGESWTKLMSVDNVSAEHFKAEHNNSPDYKVLKNPKTDGYEIYTRSKVRMFA